MSDDELALLADLHRDGARQGPGGPNETRLALTIAQQCGGLRPEGQAGQPLHVADLGCGTGASTLILAEALDAHLVAVDLIPEFLAVLRERAAAASLSDRIETVAASMDALPLSDNAFDLLWSEGAIYLMGFERGLAAWRRYLKPGGVLVVSEITWLTPSRPVELEAYWTEAYPEIATADEKIAALMRQGYDPIGHFILPPQCWWEGYYRPLEARFDAFLRRHAGNPAAEALIASERAEIDLHERHSNKVGYGMYIARRT